MRSIVKPLGDLENASAEIELLASHGDRPGHERRSSSEAQEDGNNLALVVWSLHLSESHENSINVTATASATLRLNHALILCARERFLSD